MGISPGMDLSIKLDARDPSLKNGQKRGFLATSFQQQSQNEKKRAVRKLRSPNIEIKNSPISYVS